MKKMQRIICVIMLLAILLGLVTMGITSCVSEKTRQEQVLQIEDDGDSHEGHNH